MADENMRGESRQETGKRQTRDRQETGKKRARKKGERVGTGKWAASGAKINAEERLTAAASQF